MVSICRIIKKKWFPMVGIFLCAVSAEFLIGNFSAFRSMCVEPVILTENEKTDEQDVYVSDVIVVDREVKNIYADLSLTYTKTAQITVFLTDEGDRYAYELPAFTVSPQAPDTQYANLYPYGKVHTMQITVEVPEGTHADIHTIAVNVPQPFSFKWIRAGIIFLLFGLIYTVRSGSFVHSVLCVRGNRKQHLLIAAAIAVVVTGSFFLVRINPIFLNAPWRHQHQYEELAQSLAKGEYVLSYEPSRELLSSENPYDTGALQIEGVEYGMDYAFYNGKYYVYFGIIPELLLYLPYHLLTGKNFPNYGALFVFYAMFAAGAFLMVREWIFFCKKKVPFFYYILLSLSLCFFSDYIFLVTRPEIYHVPIMAGIAFTVWGFFLWLRGLETDKGKKCCYFLGSLCMAAVSGCRPQMLVYSFFMVILFSVFEGKNRKIMTKGTWRETVCLIVPYILVGALVFSYNAARFGSGFDFGATYSLTSNDMNYRGFHVERTINGLFYFLFQPPIVRSAFPFLQAEKMQNTFAANPYLGKEMTEYLFGGIFAVCPMLCSIFYGILGGLKKIPSRIKALFFSFLAASLLITVFDLNGAGMIHRYISDMAFGWMMAAFFVWIFMLDKDADSYGLCSKLLPIFFLLGVGYGFCKIFAVADVSSLLYARPELFYKVSSYFRI